jgi:hypothetical protein
VQFLGAPPIFWRFCGAPKSVNVAPHRTAPHRTAPHRTAPRKHKLNTGRKKKKENKYKANL